MKRAKAVRSVRTGQGTIDIEVVIRVRAESEVIAGEIADRLLDKAQTDVPEILK